MSLLSRAAVLLILLGGCMVSCHKRQRLQSLRQKVHARFAHYDAGRDHLSIQRCRLQELSAQDIAVLDARIPWNHLVGVLGTCEVELGFHDYPSAGKIARLRLQARFGWAGFDEGGSGSYERGWQELPFRYAGEIGIPEPISANASASDM